MNNVHATFNDLTNRGYNNDDAKKIINLALKYLKIKYGKNYAGELVASKTRWLAAVEHAKCYFEFNQW